MIPVTGWVVIYKAVNTANGKVYIGKTSRSLDVRIKEHEYDSRNKSNTAFNRAIRKYGMEFFKFEVLERCGLWNSEEREQEYIRQFSSRSPKGYNLTDGGEGTWGCKRTPEEIDKIRAAHLGKPKSEAHKAKLRVPKSPQHIENAIFARSKPEYKARASAAQKLAWQTRSREKQSANTKEQWRKWREKRNEIAC